MKFLIENLNSIFLLLFFITFIAVGFYFSAIIGFSVLGITFGILAFIFNDD